MDITRPDMAESLNIANMREEARDNMSKLGFDR
jgi:hypothetical protein